MHLSHMLSRHNGRKFRRMSWGDEVPSCFVGKNGLSIKNTEGITVDLPVPCLMASDWKFIGESAFAPEDGKIDVVLVSFVFEDGDHRDGLFRNDEFISYLNRAARNGAPIFSALEAILDAGCKWGLKAAMERGNAFVKRFFA